MRSLLHYAIAAMLLVATVGDVLAQTDRRFSQPERSVRSRTVDQQHVRLQLAFDWDRQHMHGLATLTLAPYEPIDQLELDAADMHVHRAELLAADGSTTPLQLTTRRNTLRIDLDRTYQPGQQLLVRIEYDVTRPVHGVHFVVPDPNEPGSVPMVWTQNEPEYARYWIPCIDSPADRLTSEVIARVPQSMVVISNGVLREKTEHDDGTASWHWVQQQPHVPYLISVVAGHFEVWSQSWDGIPIDSYVPTGRLADAPRSFQHTPQMMELFSRKIGYRYPWPKYAQVCVDEYQWGGMEHTSATTLNVRTLHDERAHLDVSSDNLVAHELAHQWFGDLLTCKDWAELWLNESFATYMATVWTEAHKGWDEATWQRAEERESYLREAQRYQRPIVTYRYRQPNDMFDRHSYPKGARVLHMLRQELGDDLFWQSIQHYVHANQNRVVETADLRIAIEETTGRGMNWFFRQWIHRPGHPQLSVDWDWDSRRRQVVINVQQTQTIDEQHPPFQLTAQIEIARGRSGQIHCVRLTKQQHTFHFESPEPPTRVSFDPDDWLLATLTQDQAKEQWLDQLANDEHVMCRVRAVSALAEYREHDDVRDALCRAAKSDPFWAVRMKAADALQHFRGPQVRQALVEIAQHDPKSDVRRQAVKSLARHAHDQTRRVLRQLIDSDPSYAVVAESLRTLTAVDREHCAADLYAALQRDSHQQQILKAACDGLVKLKPSDASQKLRALLEQPQTAERRAVVIGALARLKTDDEPAVRQLVEQLDSRRPYVRQIAIAALAETASPQALDALRQHREREETPRMVQAVDEAIEKLEQSLQQPNELRKQVDELRKQVDQLRRQIPMPESAKKN